LHVLGEGPQPSFRSPQPRHTSAPHGPQARRSQPGGTQARPRSFNLSSSNGVCGRQVNRTRRCATSRRSRPLAIGNLRVADRRGLSRHRDMEGHRLQLGAEQDAGCHHRQLHMDLRHGSCDTTSFLPLGTLSHSVAGIVTYDVSSGRGQAVTKRSRAASQVLQGRPLRSPRAPSHPRHPRYFFTQKSPGRMNPSPRIGLASHPPVVGMWQPT
jgi:hypothetical protein